jgi:hypothetical protein
MGSWTFFELESSSSSVVVKRWHSSRWSGVNRPFNLYSGGDLWNRMDNLQISAADVHTTWSLAQRSSALTSVLNADRLLAWNMLSVLHCDMCSCSTGLFQIYARMAWSVKWVVCLEFEQFWALMVIWYDLYVNRCETRSLHEAGGNV